MSKGSTQDSRSAEAKSGDTALPAEGISPYATGGGGVSFERKVAVKYLAHLLNGDGATELGDGRRVVSVAFQQAPTHSVDDLVVSAARSDEVAPSLVLALAVRRRPKIVPSDERTRKLISQFIRAVIDVPPEGPEHKFGLVVAGPQLHAEQLAKLAHHAAGHFDPTRFFDLVRTPTNFDSGVRDRLNQLEKLVEHALHDLGVVVTGTELVQERTWQLLSRLTVLMPRLESPDETDWGNIVNSLVQVARDSGLSAASQLRDRLVALASDYSPQAACVDLTMVRRESHALLDTTARWHKHGWQTLNRIHRRACESVRAKITSSDGTRYVSLDRSTATMKLLEAVSCAEAMVVSGESGVGKSALAVSGLTAAATAEPDHLQVVCINLRQVPNLVMEIEGTLLHPLSTLLAELSAPQRMLVVDGADAVTEDKRDTFRYLIAAAKESGLKLIAVTSLQAKQVVLDALSERFDGSYVGDYVVSPLRDSEIDELARTFTELDRLNSNPRSRELLRRLVVVDLLVRARGSGNLRTDVDAMNEVWSGLVRRHEMNDRGFPDTRETALLRLAELELGESERLDVISAIEPAALDGLRRDGLVRTSTDAPFMIGPEFSHDEVRRYAIARLLLTSDKLASRLLQAGAPRWSLAAARLACQAWLAQPDTSTTPLRGRFAVQQASFDGLVDAGHGGRWGDVPSEALLMLANPDALLRDAWPDLLADEAAGLRRLARLIDQRHRDENYVMDVITVEPIIKLLLEDPEPWRSGKHIQGLFRGWLRSHVIANTGAGQPLRVLLSKRLVEACDAADRRLAEKHAAVAAARAARTPEEIEQERQLMESHGFPFSEIGYGDQRRRQRPEVPMEIKDEVVLEFLALLGPDLGDDGEAILGRVAKDAPSSLGPAVDELFTGQALARGRQGLLAELTEAYYLDDEVDDDWLQDYGIRQHLLQGMNVPLTAWHLGPFMPLFQSDFLNGVAVLNRLLNHAALIRARVLARLDQGYRSLETISIRAYQHELSVTGACRSYVGDEQVWHWYRQTGVGPYPCISALRALERVTDQLIKQGIPIRGLVTILLSSCENLAMVGLVVGLLVRHLEDTDDLLDPFLTEPLVWRQEFARVVYEANPFAGDSNDLVAPERRKWSLRESAVLMVIRARDERTVELSVLGKKLVANARRAFETTREDSASAEQMERKLAPVRAWASSLDRARYTALKDSDGIQIQATPPDDVVKALQASGEELKLVGEVARLFVRYHIKRTKEHAVAYSADELEADIETAQTLLENPLPLGAPSPSEISALVAAVALESHLLEAADLSEDALSFAAETVLRIAEEEAAPREFEFAGTIWEQGPDRSAARALPLLLLPVAEHLRAVLDEEDGSTTYNRVLHAGLNSARAVADEVRLHLARGLDHVWAAPCVEHGHCHHKLAWQLATETMRHCLLSARDPETGQRSLLTLDEPLTKSLARTAADSILVSRLDGAIRALAPASMAHICISAQARALLLALLAAQRRSLLNIKHRNPDDRDTHTLVSARALLALAKDGDDTAIYEQIDAYADNSILLGKLLRALSAAAEETPARAETARRVWPNIIRHVLELNESGHTPFQGAHHGDMALTALIPNSVNELPYLYREVSVSPIMWWDPIELRAEVEVWLALAKGNPRCVDQLVGFVQMLESDDQVQVGLPCMSMLVLADPTRVVRGSYMLTSWLIEMRSVAADSGLMNMWQKIVDDLVVAGETRLALYSD